MVYLKIYVRDEKLYLKTLDLEVDPVDVADDGSVGHGGVAAVVVVGAAERLHVNIADVVV